jgi:hypothetical protein
MEGEMSAADEIRKLLRDYGAVLVRQRKHEVWRFPERECRKNPDRKPKPGIDHRPEPCCEPVGISPESDWKTQLTHAMHWVQFERWKNTARRRTP